MRQALKHKTVIDLKSSRQMVAARAQRQRNQARKLLALHEYALTAAREQLRSGALTFEQRTTTMRWVAEWEENVKKYRVKSADALRMIMRLETQRLLEYGPINADVSSD